MCMRGAYVHACVVCASVRACVGVHACTRVRIYDTYMCTHQILAAITQQRG